MRPTMARLAPEGDPSLTFFAVTIRVTLQLPITCLSKLTPAQHSEVQDSTNDVRIPAVQAPSNTACFWIPLTKSSLFFFRKEEADSSYCLLGLSNFN